MRWVQGKSRKSAGQTQQSSGKGKVLSLEAAPRAKQRGHSRNFSQQGSFLSSLTNVTQLYHIRAGLKLRQAAKPLRARGEDPN